MTADTRRDFRLLFLCLASTGMGQAVLLAILPPVARNAGLSTFQISTVFVTSAVCWAVMSPRWGRLSDRVGRRRVLLVGLLGYAVSMGLLATVVGLLRDELIAVSVAWLAMIGARSLFGLFGSASPPAAQAFVADRTSSKDRAAGVALLNASFGFGQTAGPAAGAALAVFGILAPIYFSVGLALLSAVAIFFLLPESRTETAARQVGRAKLRFLDRRIRPFFLLQAFMQAVRAVTMLTIALFFTDQLSLGEDQASRSAMIGLMVLAIAGLVSQLGIVQILRPPPVRMIQGGFLSAMIGFSLLLLGSTFSMYLGGLSFLGLGLGLVRPGNAAAVSMAVSPEEQGAVAGLLGSVGVTGNIFGPMLGGFLYDVEPNAPVLLNLALMAVGLTYAVLHPRVRQARVQP